MFLLLALVSLVGAVRADQVAELAKIHIEAIGGMKRIEKLTSLRATGLSGIAGKPPVRFTLTAARPAKIRLETEAKGRTLVQGFDGDEPAWEFDTGTWPPQYRLMADATAKTFVADAEFDDPLVGAEKRGFILEYAGELEQKGRKLIRILVTRKLQETYAVLLDEQTFFIVARIDQRTTAGGRKMEVTTHYEDFRPVEGVLLPHLITVAVDGKPSQQTKIARIDPNPPLTDETFSRPKKVTVPGVRPADGK
ncbi:MAG: hypothetical protein V4773_01050 [Verrucomicrobiota bacterium]